MSPRRSIEDATLNPIEDATSNPRNPQSEAVSPKDPNYAFPTDKVPIGGGKESQVASVDAKTAATIPPLSNKGSRVLEVSYADASRPVSKASPSGDALNLALNYPELAKATNWVNTDDTGNQYALAEAKIKDNDANKDVDCYLDLAKLSEPNSKLFNIAESTSKVPGKDANNRGAAANDGRDGSHDTSSTERLTATEVNTGTNAISGIASLF